MKNYFNIIPALALILVLFSCEAISQKKTDVRKVKLTAHQGKAIFEAVVGVDSAISGYAGGNVPNPTYDLVNTETTGHAETVLVYYNPKVITYAELCKVFFASHDPTTPNQQGPDRGSSYRSILFYTGEAEKAAAQQSVKDATNSGRFKKSIVTELKPLTEFYRAEGYHQDYIEHNPNQGYVRAVSIPRFELFKKTYKGRLK